MTDKTKDSPITKPTNSKENALNKGNSKNFAQKSNAKKTRPRPNMKNDRGGEKEFEESILKINRVTRVTKGGRQMRFRLTVAIGNKKGKIAFGLGKSTEVVLAVKKAVAKAKKNLTTIPIFNGTLAHEVVGNFKASKVLLFPAPEGKGVIAGGVVRKILELAGVKNVLSKIHGSRNRVNIAYATLDALFKLQKRPITKTDPKKEEKDSNEKSIENFKDEDKKNTKDVKVENSKIEDKKNTKDVKVENSKIKKEEVKNDKKKIIDKAKAKKNT